MRLKKLKIFLVIIGLLIVGIFIASLIDFSGGHEPAWGVTFTPRYAEDLALDWRETYLAILDDLAVDHIRLSAYWDQLEPNQDQYDFSDLDWQIEQAANRDVAIVLAVGRRLPRWPECHDPDWLAGLSAEEINQELLELLALVVNRYQNVTQISRWQVENEPLLRWFGECPPPDPTVLDQEVALVRSLDSSRSIIITDSGELSSWQPVAGRTDILGTTIYRIVWNRWLGFFEYWFVPPAAYRWKADLTHALHPNLEAVIVTELQMEPWTLDKRMVDMTLEEQQRSFDLERFNKNIDYVRRTGFGEVNLWGVEYWYWLKEQGRPEIWQAAQSLWQ